MRALLGWGDTASDPGRTSASHWTRRCALLRPLCRAERGCTASM